MKQLGTIPLPPDANGNKFELRVDLVFIPRMALRMAVFSRDAAGPRATLARWTLGVESLPMLRSLIGDAEIEAVNAGALDSKVYDRISLTPPTRTVAKAGWRRQLREAAPVDTAPLSAQAIAAIETALSDDEAAAIAAALGGRLDGWPHHPALRGFAKLAAVVRTVAKCEEQGMSRSQAIRATSDLLCLEAGNVKATIAGLRPCDRVAA